MARPEHVDHALDPRNHSTPGISVVRAGANANWRRSNKHLVHRGATGAIVMGPGHSVMGPVCNGAPTATPRTANWSRPPEWTDTGVTEGTSSTGTSDCERPANSGVNVKRKRSETDQTIQKEHTSKLLVEETHQMYPQLLKRNYVTPPVRFNRVFYTRKYIGEVAIKVLELQRMSDIRSDECLQHIHKVFTALSERTSDVGVMFICFSLVFDNYLNYGGKTNTRRKKKRGADPTQNGTDHRGSQQTSPDLRQSRHSDRWNKGGSATNLNLENKKDNITSPSFLQTTVDLSVFPRPRDYQHSRGEFDVLIISRQHGIIFCEIKSVGGAFELSPDCLSVSEQHSVIRAKVGRSLDQLDKQEKMLGHLLSDLHTHVPVTKVLILPNLKRKQLQDAMEGHPDLEQKCCQTFECATLHQALQKCIFSQQLPPIAQSVNANDDVITELLRDWWKPLTDTIPQWSINDRLYELLVSRFCGPATKQYMPTSLRPRAEVSTLTQAVQETSRCFTAPVLTSEQVDTLRAPYPRLLLRGPPGTGKTLMLTLKALEWLRHGHHVMVVSLWTASHAVSCYIDHQVRERVTSEEAKRLRLVLNRRTLFEDVITNLQMLRSPLGTTLSAHCSTSAEPTEQVLGSLDSGFGDFDLHADDCNCDSGEDSTLAGQPLHVLVAEAPWFLDKLLLVLEKVLGKDSYVVWASTSSPGGAHLSPPPDFTSVELTQNLRCPPAVVREMMTSPAYQAFQRPVYTSQDDGDKSGMPPPTDGPQVKRVDHAGHGGGEVWSCERCGEAVAFFLTQELKIGRCPNPMLTASITSSAEMPFSTQAPDDPLTFSDVLISGHLPSLRDVIGSARGGKSSEKMVAGQEVRSHSPPGFLKGLRQKGVQYDVMDKDDVSSYWSLAFPKNPDRVQVAEPELVKGMERKVVVVVGTVDFPEAAPCYVDPCFDVMGCCTSQLVRVGDAESSLVEKLNSLSISHAL